MTKMDTSPHGKGLAPIEGSLDYHHEYAKEAAQKKSPEKISEEWSDLRKATGFVGLLTMILAVAGILASFEIKKMVESYCCINKHDPQTPEANLSNLPEFSYSPQAMEMLLNLSALLLVISATEAFAGILLICGILKKSYVLLEIWVLVTLLWMTVYIMTSVLWMSHHITPHLVLMILGPACIVTGIAALCVVLMYWVQLLSEEKQNDFCGKYGKNQASENGDKEENSNGPSVCFLKKECYGATKSQDYEFQL